MYLLDFVTGEIAIGYTFGSNKVSVDLGWHIIESFGCISDELSRDITNFNVSLLCRSL